MMTETEIRGLSHLEAVNMAIHYQKEAWEEAHRFMLKRAAERVRLAEKALASAKRHHTAVIAMEAPLEQT